MNDLCTSPFMTVPLDDPSILKTTSTLIIEHTQRFPYRGRSPVKCIPPVKVFHKVRFLQIWTSRMYARSAKK